MTGGGKSASPAPYRQEAAVETRYLASALIDPPSVVQ